MNFPQKSGIGIILLLILIICTTTALAVVPIQLSDQGTSVKQTATGQILNTGNLSVEIYDSDSGGTLLWNKTYFNAIVNGSWNVMLGELNELNLSYGVKYFKDYKINNFDINFTNGTGGLVDRKAFYSPLGEIDKSYVDNSSNKFVDINGDVMTGPLTVNTNLSVSNITPINADWGVTIRNGSGGKIVLVNTTAGQLEVWNPLEGTGDYMSLYHDGTSGNINTQSGNLLYRIGGTLYWIMTDSTFYPGYSNSRDIGTAAYELRAQYLGEGASSGTYYGLDQDWRMWNNGTNNNLMIDSGSTNRITINSTSGNVGIGTISPAKQLELTGAATSGATNNGPMLSLYENNGYSGSRRFTFRNGWSTTTGMNALFLDVENDAGSSIVRNLMTMQSGGNVGVNSVAPTATLDVNSTNALGALSVHNTTGTSLLFVNGSSGKIGIGTTTPTTVLEVKGGASNQVMQLSASDGDKMFYFDTLTSQPYMDAYKDGGSTIGVHLSASGSSYLTPGNSFGIGNTAPAMGLHVGTGSSSHSLTNVNDTFVTGNFETDGTNYFDGASNFASTTTFNDNVNVAFGSAYDSVIDWSTAQATSNSVVWGLGNLEGNNIIFTTNTLRDDDYDHPSQTNPTIFVQANEDPDANNDRWISITHDNASGVIDSGYGQITLDDTAFVSGNLSLSDNVVGTTMLDIYDDGSYLVFNSTNDVKMGNDMTVLGNLNVTGTSYLGNLVLQSENISTTNILPLNVNTGVTVRNGSGGKLGFFNTTSGRLEVWSPLEGTGDYVNIWHDGTQGVINSASGTLYLGSALNYLLWTGDLFYSAGTPGTDDLGAATYEWRANYLGEDAASGTYFGLDQDSRIWSNSTDSNSLNIKTPLLKIWDDAEGANDNVQIYHDGTNGYVSSASGYLMLSGGTSVFSANNFLPSAGNSRDLGATAGYTWRSLYLGNGTSSGIYFDNAQASTLLMSNAQATAPTMVWGTPSTNAYGNSVIVADNARITSDYDHPAQTNPTLFVQSLENPDANNDRWISVTHDNTSAVIDSGYGNITLDDTSFISGNLEIADNLVGTLAAEIGDDGTNFIINSTKPMKLGNNVTIYGDLNVTGTTYAGNGTTVITASSVTTHTINVTETAYLGNVIINTENITVTNVLPKNVNTGVNIRNDSGGLLLRVNATSGRTEFWDEAEGADDYLSIYHDGTNGRINAASGNLILMTGGGNRYFATSTAYYPDAANTADLGTNTINEWRALYLGNGTSSGLYFGLGQESNLLMSNAQATAPTMVLGTPSTNAYGNSVIVADNARITSDYDHPAQTNPTLFVQSLENPDANNDRWVSLTHDNTSAVIDSGYGNITLDDTTFVGGDLQVADNVVGTETFSIEDNGTNIVLGFLTSKPLVMGEFSSPVNPVLTLKSGNIYLGNLSPHQGFNGNDIFASGRLESREGLWSEATDNGYGLMVHDYGYTDWYTSPITANVTFNGTTHYLCDDTNKPFNTSFVGKFTTLVTSSYSSYVGATGEFDTYVNTSCMHVNTGSGGTVVYPDASGILLAVYNAPVLAALDNGVTHITIGSSSSTSDEAQFHISSPNSYSPHSLLLEDKTMTNDHTAMTIDFDVNNFTGINGLSILGKSTASSAAGIESSLLYLEGKETNVYNSTLSVIKARVLGAGTNNNSMRFLDLGPAISTIINQGSSDALSAAWYNNSGYTNMTNNLSTSVNNTQLFQTVNSELYIGNTVNFTSIAFSLQTLSSASITPTFWYCNTTRQYQQMTTGYTDTTTGFTSSGSWSFINPSNRGVCNQGAGGTPFGEVNNLTYVMIRRTRSSLPTPPTENKATISGGTTNFLLLSDMLKLNIVSAPPRTCDATMEGAIYADNELNKPCYCTGANWVLMSDYTTVCS